MAINIDRNFTIRDLERFTGVKAHTLRIWEQRYHLLRPARAGNNTRLYTLDDLKRILDIALLNQHGNRISVLAKISPADITQTIKLLSHDPTKWKKAINDLVINMYTPEPGAFEAMLDNLLAAFQWEIVVEKIMYPFLKASNLLWTGNKLFEEHFVVTSARKKLIVAIEMTVVIAKKNKPVLAFLPGTRQLDLGLLYSNYFLKRRGIEVLYMGNDVTLENLSKIFHSHPPAYLFTYLPANHNFPVNGLLRSMKQHIPDAKLVIGAYPGQTNSLVSDNLVQMNYEEALDYLYVYGG